MPARLAVVSQTGNSLSFFDLDSGERVKHLTDLHAEPHELCLDSKRNVIYVSHTYRHGHYWTHGDESHEISVVDASTMSIVDIIDTTPAKAPHGIWLDAPRDILYATVEVLPNEESGGVIGIDLKTRKVIKYIPSGYKSHWLVVTADGRKAFTSNKTADFISALDLENERMIGKIDVPSHEEPSISPDGRFAYFPTPGLEFGKNAAEPELKVVDTTLNKIVHSVKLQRGATPTHVTPDGTILTGEYFFNEDDKGAVMAMYDPKTYEKLGEAPLGRWPLTIKSSTDGKLGFSANVLQGTVTVVDLISKKVVRTLVVDPKDESKQGLHVGAHGMAYIPDALST